MALSRRRGRWVCDFRDQNKRRRWMSFRTRAEAEAALAEAKIAINKPEFIAPSQGKTFEELCTAYLENVKPSVRASTYFDYSTVVGRHLLPYFGGRKLRDILLEHVEGFRNQLLGKKVEGADKRMRTIGPRTVNKSLVLLSMMFGYAMKHKWASSNVAALCARIKDEETEEEIAEETFLKPHEITRLLAACDDYLKPLVMTAAYTGLRQGSCWA
jgi:integrase